MLFSLNHTSLLQDEHADTAPLQLEHSLATVACVLSIISTKSPSISIS